MRDYNQPDPPEPVSRVKFILDLYAHEIRDHASGMLAIYDLCAADRQAYKDHCFEAARHLTAAADCVRGGSRVIDLTVEPTIVIEKKEDVEDVGHLPVLDMAKTVAMSFLIFIGVCKTIFWTFPGVERLFSNLIGR